MDEDQQRRAEKNAAMAVFSVVNKQPDAACVSL